MKSPKSIERLFQEGLKDFQASPSPKVWEGIESKLSENKASKRFLPLWWQVASVAAILLIFSSIGFFYYKPLDSKASFSNKENSNYKSPSNSLEVIPAQYRFTSVNEKLSMFENAITTRLDFTIKELENISYAVANSEESFREFISVGKNDENEIRFSEVSQLNSFSVNPFSNSITSSSLLTNEVKEEIVKENPTFKKSLFDAIEEENLMVQTDDFISKPWEVKPNVAPVFMNSLNGGNPVESSLQGKTSSNANVSFGVNVAYAINKKMKIRTGINQVAMGYNTQDVILSTTSSSFRAENSGNLNVKNTLIGDVSLVSAVSNSSNVPMGDMNNSSFSNSPSQFSSIGAINHELGFVEVPLEIEYALIDKKIGVHLLGGASTYLLNNNEIFFEDNGGSSSIGEAENLNSFSFSANFGVGMDYNFTKTVSFNLEPKFMYQINTFQNNASNFQPYFFGIYSGIKFKF